MKNTDQANDENMEELLASIRKIIADDLASTGPSSVSPLQQFSGASPKSGSYAAAETLPHEGMGGSEDAPLYGVPDETGPSPADGEILDLGEEFLVEDGAPADLDEPSPAVSADNSFAAPTLEASPRLPGPVAEPSFTALKPPAPQFSAASAKPGPELAAPASFAGSTAPMLPDFPAPERPVSRPSWSGRDPVRDRHEPSFDRNRQPREPAMPEPPAPAASAPGPVAAAQSPAAATAPQTTPAPGWSRVEPDAFSSGVQMPVPPSGPFAPFPGFGSAQGGAPEAAAGPAAARPATPFPAPPAPKPAPAVSASRISSPVTSSGTGGEVRAGFPSPATRDALPNDAHTRYGETPQYLKTIAQDLARAAIGHLEDDELAEAKKKKLAQPGGPSLGGVTSSFAHAIVDNGELQRNIETVVIENRFQQHAASELRAVPAGVPGAAGTESRVSAPQGETGQAASFGGNSFEDSFRELLRPMLLQWLDENMPRLLDEAIQDEVKRRLDQK